MAKNLEEQQPGQRQSTGAIDNSVDPDPTRLASDVPNSPRSGASERQGDDDEGSMAIGTAEPHEDQEEVDAREKRDEPHYDREHRMASPAEAGNQHDGRGEMSQQREALKGQYRLGYPGSEK